MFKLNNSGAVDTAYNVSGLELTAGIWANPANGHLVASGEAFDPQNLIDVLF